MNTNKKIDYKKSNTSVQSAVFLTFPTYNRDLLQLGSFFFCNDINILLTKLITQIWEWFSSQTVEEAENKPTVQTQNMETFERQNKLEWYKYYLKCL